jgi:hypothetical protein
MNHDDEMMMELLMEDEADTTTNQEQQMMVLNALLHYQDNSPPSLARGGSRVGKAKNKNRHRLACALLLDSDYFVEDAANTHKEFRHCYQMNKEFFIKIVFGI